MSKSKSNEKPICIGKTLDEHYNQESGQVSFDKPVVDIDAFVKANKEFSQGEEE